MTGKVMVRNLPQPIFSPRLLTLLSTYYFSSHFINTLPIIIGMATAALEPCQKCPEDTPCSTFDPDTDMGFNVSFYFHYISTTVCSTLIV